MKLEFIKREVLKEKPADESKLGFGRIFSDYMLMMKYDEAKGGWYYAAIEPYENLSISPAALVFHYAQECFEGMKAYRTADGEVMMFRPWDNVHRMNISGERLCMAPIPEDFLLQSIYELIKVEKDWIPSSPGTSLYIRPTFIGIDPVIGVKAASQYLLYVILSPVGSYYASGLAPVSIYVENKYVRAVKGGTGYTKCGGNYAASLKAGEVAHERGYSQVLWLDGRENKYIDEHTGEIFVELGDQIGQDYYRRRSGAKTDLLFNFGYNYLDQLYLGVNLGLPVLDYRDDFTFTETSLRDGYFQTGFRRSEEYEYTEYVGGGAYAKFGVIWRPIGGLRVAATYQTPTVFSIEERYGWSSYLDASEITGNETKAADGNFAYTLRTPSITGLGVAYTLAGLGLLSFDWERTNYSKMYYTLDRRNSSEYSSIVSDVNADILNNGGSANQYRIGAELMLTPNVALRAGFTENDRKLSDGSYSTRRSYSGGLGYASDGSFFIDLALRWNVLPDYYNYPYDLYNDNYTQLVYESPEIIANRRSLDAVVTVGLRF